MINMSKKQLFAFNIADLTEAMSKKDCFSPMLFANRELSDEVLIELEALGIVFLDMSLLLQNEWESQHPYEKTRLATNELAPPAKVLCLFPWKRTLVRILEEDAFVNLRTLRNLYKHTTVERELFRSKKIGIIGLSVGQSVALPVALERIAGTIRLADFDKLELTNMNRILGSILDIGNTKVLNTSRMIAEIDPYLNVEVFPDGVNQENIEEFLVGNGKLDLVIEECDSGEIKLLTRILCRKHRIPVIMETSDRGLLDIERFDLEPERPLLHGMLHEGQNKAGLTSEEKRQLLMNSIDFSKVSERGLSSMHEVGKSIKSWPQLATDVISGGATAALAARLIFSGIVLKSGRVYVDIQSRILEELGSNDVDSQRAH